MTTTAALAMHCAVIALEEGEMRQTKPSFEDAGTSGAEMDLLHLLTQEEL